LGANTEIIDGIERRFGKPVAFWIETINAKGEIKYRRIPLVGPKSGKTIGIHYFEKEQVDQVRGIGVLAAMFSSLERMQQAIILEMDSMAANATVAAAIVRDKSTVDTDKLLREFGGETASDTVEKPQDAIKTSRVETKHGGIILQNFEGGESLESFDTKRPI
jgi:capsid protein